MRFTSKSPRRKKPQKPAKADKKLERKKLLKVVRLTRHLYYDHETAKWMSRPKYQKEGKQAKRKRDRRQAKLDLKTGD